MIHISSLLLPMKTSHVALPQSHMAVKAVSAWGALHCSRAASSLNVRLSLLETKPETNALPYEIMSSPQLSPKGQCKVSIAASSWRTRAPHFLALCFIALSQIFLFFFFSYRLNICGKAASSKSVGTIFPIASLHFTSLCHILVILAVFQTFSFLYLSWWFVIRWVIVNVTLVIVLGHHEAFPHKMVNLIPKCCVCSEYYISLLVLFLKEGLVWLQYRKLINNPTVGD